MTSPDRTTAVSTTTAIRPQDDLFLSVNGAWLAEAEIPGDLSSIGAMVDLRLESERHVGDLLHEAAAADPGAGGPYDQIGAMFASFVDTDRVEALGATPLAADLGRIEALADLGGFARLLGEFERSGVSGIVRSYVDNDDRNSDRYVVNLLQGGTSLPDEAYYREEQFAEIREQYRSHVERMLALVGIADPADAAARVFAVEEKLAAGHWDKVACRDVLKTYNLRTLAEIEALCPAFDWTGWVVALGGTPGPDGTIGEATVRQPSYLETLTKVLADTSLDDWKLWLSWKLVHAYAPYLSQAFVDENFDFYSRILSGAEDQRDRWKRGVALVESTLSEAVGQIYVERHFPPAAKERMDELVANLIEAYRQSISTLDWMSADTQSRAQQKLDRFTPKIGYPDTWKDYSAIVVDRGDLVGNVRRARAWETDRELRKIGSAVDRSEWFMSPQTVNAYYNPGTNEICFPAAILQPPFFALDASDASNYGAIGAVIGHEIGHGFDDQGSQFDGDGNLSDWWTDADRTAFTARSEALISQFSELRCIEVPDVPVNGGLTVGENIGDLGGLTIGLKAYEIAAGDAATDEDRREVFFSWARAWRSKRREQLARQYLQIDPHSPPDLRANIARNIDGFHAAFGTTEDDGMWLAESDRVRIW
ncbi:MAG: M13-type metalloendopeptidase [Nakamurella sp.]